MGRPTIYGDALVRQVHELAAMGHTVRAAQQVLRRTWPKVSIGTVSRHWPGTHKSTIKERTKRKLSERNVRALKQHFFKDQLPNSRRATCWLAKELGVKVHRSTVCRAMKKCGLSFRRRLKKPRLTKGQVEKRMKWALNTANTLPPPNKLLFSDEKRWNLYGPDGACKAWDDDAHRKVQEKAKFDNRSVYVWACIGADYTSQLYVYPKGSCTAESYISTLDKERRVGAFQGGRVLIQDGASWHTARAVGEWTQKHARAGVRVVTLPPNSPDLNPIENLWGILTYRVYEGHAQYATEEALCAAIQAEWAKIQADGSLRGNLVGAFPARLEKLIKAKGKWPKA